MKNYYEILQVNKCASEEVINKVYKMLAKKYHPDLQPEDRKLEMQEKLKLINEAYEVLSNSQKRKEYDMALAEFENNQIDEIKNLKAQNNYLKRQVENLNNLLNNSNKDNMGVNGALNNNYEQKYYTNIKDIPLKIRIKAYAKYYFKLFLYKFSAPIAVILTIIIFTILFKLGIIQKILKLNYDYNQNNIGTFIQSGYEEN